MPLSHRYPMLLKAAVPPLPYLKTHGHRMASMIQHLQETFDMSCQQPHRYHGHARLAVACAKGLSQ